MLDRSIVTSLCAALAALAREVGSRARLAQLTEKSASAVVHDATRSSLCVDREPSSAVVRAR